MTESGGDIVVGEIIIGYMEIHKKLVEINLSTKLKMKEYEIEFIP